MDGGEDSAVVGGMLNFPFDCHEMNSKVFIPFEINDSSQFFFTVFISSLLTQYMYGKQTVSTKQ